MNYIDFTSFGILRISVLLFLFALVLALWIPNAFATDKSGNTMWELIFLSPYGGCTNYQYQMTNTYDEITSKYFELYKFANSKHLPQCMSDKKYTNYKPPQDLDLLILVYDNEIGKKELHLNDVGGLYSHVGVDRTKNHVIVICDCSNFGFSDPAWTLSHELSHFITYYLGFGLSVQNTIHVMSSKYNECIESTRDTSCSNVVTDIHGDLYFTSATVMTPYQPAVGKNLAGLENAIHDSPNVEDSPVVLNMQKEITRWWLAGEINDTEYTTVLSYVMGNQTQVKSPDMLPANILLESGPDGHEENSTYYNLDMIQNQKTTVLLKRSPFKENNTDVSDKMQIPQWFKFQANGWVQNNTWNNKDFVDSIKHLFGQEQRNSK